MMLFVRGVISEMSMSLSFINGVGAAMVIITAMIKIMSVQLNPLRAQQCQ